MATRAPSKCLAYRGQNAKHEFAADSGWCIYGCGLRQDGRHTTTGGDVIDPGPNYTHDALTTIATKLRERTAHDRHHRNQPTLNLAAAEA